MRRTQIQLDQAGKEKQYPFQVFSFVGSGRSKGKISGSIAKRHDEEFANGSMLRFS